MGHHRSSHQDRKNWTPADWENYLSEIEVGLKEALISQVTYQRCLENQTESLFALSEHDCPKELRDMVRKAMQTLSANQNKIIKLVFWNRLSEREIATQMGISRSSVKTTKARALKKLKPLLIKANVTHFTNCEGQTFLSFRKGEMK